MNNLKQFKDIHKGRRAFAACGGTGLADLDLTLLENEIVFGSNRVYIADDIHINYLFVGDKKIANQFSLSFASAPVDTVFTSEGIYKEAFRHENHYYFRGHGAWKFHTDITERIHGGRSISFVVMQFAYYMGIQELYFIGMDHYWNEETSEAKGRQLTTVGADINHFDPEYYGDGVVWYQPKYKEMEKSFLMARKAYDADGRLLRNASSWTKLDESIIPIVNYEGLFNG